MIIAECSQLYINVNTHCTVRRPNMKTATAVSFVSFSCLWQLLRRAHVDSALGCHLDAVVLMQICSM